ncbi:MAG: hypothetical protein JW832_14760 [Deltaproteobacteria bacterium]|nr:hypothetical protein [Deltaproteobacteria bacterium]
MDRTLSEYIDRFETALNADQELQRRLQGFKTFAGQPDGHYMRARQQGSSALARAVRCYPFGGTTHLGDGELVGICIRDDEKNNSFVIARAGDTFTVRGNNWTNPRLTITLSKELFKKIVLGRYRWIWVFGMDGVAVTWCKGLPHSDWITLLELLVVMQELVECDPELLKKIEHW